nr:hypothetical protein [Planctomycetales bacterium]NIN09227.1 hypothetical protein [Planctomycetales bacterium]NIN78327.1 hypothetical protein [Planctomycetales bacterium]NIO35506.1 hypothetical protein [Planctomycetales bacterium]NIO47276.1 hypothetical protein [Planctomycetales bacterium]
MKNLLLMLALLGMIALAGGRQAGGELPAEQITAEKQEAEEKQSAGKQETEKQDAEKKDADKPDAEKQAADKQDSDEQGTDKQDAEKQDTDERDADEQKSDKQSPDTQPAEKTAQQAPGDDPSETVTVEQALLKIEVELEGVFEAEQTREIAVHTDEWSELTVDWAIPHGRRVKKGAALLRLNTRKIDIALADLEAGLESAKLAVQQTKASLELLQKSVPESLAAARRTASEASENLQRFHEIEKADMIKDVEQTLLHQQQALSYQQEELRQLEKMYQADDLTEETEEIVLTRARHRVERFEYWVQKAQRQKQLFDTVMLPRYEANLTQAATQTQLALEKAEETLPVTLAETRLSLEK